MEPRNVRTTLLAALLLLPVATQALAATPPIEVAIVPSDGTPRYVSVIAGRYEIVAQGEYHYSLGPNVADADRATSETATCEDRPGNILDLLVNGASPWTGPCDRLTHAYATTYLCPLAVAPCRIELRIYDDYYADNSGSLNVIVRRVSPEGSQWTLEVPSDGERVTLLLPPANTYAVTASGTYEYAVGERADAEYSHGSVGPCTDLPGDLHDLVVTGAIYFQNGDWSRPCQPQTSIYTRVHECLDPNVCMPQLYIHDDWYADNADSIAVTFEYLEAFPPN